MPEMKSLLIELGTEELPVKALPALAQAFFDGIVLVLTNRGIAFERGEAKPLYSPRRLAVLLPNVAVEQPEQRSEVLGPYLNIALDAQGQPTKALQGFAHKAGVDWAQLERTTDHKGERFVHRTIRPGARTATLLPELVREAIAAMPIPKPMRWGDHDHAFARPLHWLVLLLGSDVVEGEVFGIRADRMSRGHRFMHDKPVWIGRPEDYVDALRGAKVLVEPAERRERIVREVNGAASQAGGVAHIDDDNLAQVNCLVEWPKAVTCSFEAEFLAVPQEALVATMQTNQKFFPVLDENGKLTEHFIGIANIESRDEAEIRKGYERVIRPRFADAQFFFIEDMKQGLVSMNAGLKTVTYQAKLGTIADKVARVAAIAQVVAARVGVDPEHARMAALLSKADLQSRLVNEFPELQGIAGRYYAAMEQQPLEVAAAIEEGYLPRQAGDTIAPSKLGQVLAIADRLDTLAGGFAAGLKPTGSKDPFGLRRHALALVRTILEGNLELNPSLLLATARLIQPANTFDVPKIASEKAAEEFRERIAMADTYDPGGMQAFVFDRLRSYYDDRGVPSQHFDAVETAAPVTLPDFNRRLAALGEFAKLPEAEALAAANKRIRNILRKVEGEIPAAVAPALFTEPAERDLHEAVEQAIADSAAALAQRDYITVLARLARLRPQVDAFFDSVMVNVDDSAVRNNRLALLQRLAERLGAVAAIEHLSV